MAEVRNTPLPPEPEDVRVLRCALRTTSLGTLCEGADGRIVAANGALRDLFALGPDCDLTPGAEALPVLEAIARRCPPDHPAARPVSPEHHRRLRRVAEIPLPDGRTVVRQILPLRERGSYLGTFWSFRDVTEDRRAVRELRRRNAELELRLREQWEATAAASHELRTPLAAVISFCELLTDPASGDLSAGQRDFLNAVARNARSMRKVLDRLLPLPGEDGGGGDPHPWEPGEVRVPRLLAHAAEDRMPAVAAEGVFLTVRCADGPPLYGDEHLLGQVVTNLLGNAAKYTPAGGDIRVSAAPCGGGWEIEVADTGIGVPPEARDAVFRPGYRAANAERAGRPGSGIGLAVSRDIVRLHGGTLTAGGAEGGGAVFRLRLPLPGGGLGAGLGSGDGGGPGAGGGAP
ncbi:ATP-binding protein [Streptomyces boncukensis]|uniref:histidine kinase n=1 Tax=Streptomyces boncukensis TaxID=2711219 RepID=A0A6G4WVT0_9ACTN|nr:sensor histidine kinase [Streptomyces boncukensis]